MSDSRISSLILTFILLHFHLLFAGTDWKAKYT